MNRSAILFLSVLNITAFAQSNVLTFTNNSGVVYRNVTVIQIQRDVVLFRLSGEKGYAKENFTNMPSSVQLRFGYEVDKIKKAEADRVAKAKAAEEQRVAWEKAHQYDSIREHEFRFDPIDESVFPKTEKAQAICREITSELNGIHKVIEIGVSYSKFSDLLTEKVIAIQKIKDLRGDDIPYSFFRRVDSCIEAYTQSRHWWSEEINSEYAPSKRLCDYFMRDYWSIAGLYLEYCRGIAEKNTGVNSLIPDRLASIIKAEQDAVRDGTLKNDQRDPVLFDLSSNEIAERIRSALSETNSTSIGTKK